MISQDVILNKKLSIERCVLQIRKYYAQAENFRENSLRQDAISANLQRIADLCIDLANHIIKNKKLGLPTSASESFKILADRQIIDQQLSAKLMGMVGFRNILVHQYQQINLDLMIDVIENHLDMPINYAQTILLLAAGDGE